VKKLILSLIRYYQKNVTTNTGANCRFRPTCSEYAYQAVSKYGVCKGGLKAVWRILRCNPLGRGGYDPVN
jgi:putative membrane protein insertion efficiency factor